MGRQADQGASRQAGREEEGKRGGCGVTVWQPKQPERTKNCYLSRCGWAHRDTLGWLPPPLSPSSDRTWGMEQTPIPEGVESRSQKCRRNPATGCRPSGACTSIPSRHWRASRRWADRSHAGGCGGNQHRLLSSLRCYQPFRQINKLYTQVINTTKCIINKSRTLSDSKHPAITMKCSTTIII